MIAGGARGIGPAGARRLARAADASAPGHDVAAGGRLARAEVPSWARELGVHAAALRLHDADLATEASVRAAMARADADGRGLTGLVVSAGIGIPSRSHRLPAVGRRAARHGHGALGRRRRGPGVGLSGRAGTVALTRFYNSSILES